MPARERPQLEVPAAPPLAVPADLSLRLRELGVALSDAAVDQLAAYLALLLAMNEKINLTGVTDPAEVWTKHALDALSLVPLLPAEGAPTTLADVGAGGGLPGIPLAIARPDLRVTLVEATQKKASFLVTVSDRLSLGNVKVCAARAEDLAKSELAGTFDVVTARAVARLQALLPLTAPLARPGGLLLLVKGQRAEEELEQAKGLMKKLGLRHEGTRQTPTGRVVALRK